MRQLDASLKRVADDERFAYLPIFEAIEVALKAEPGHEFTDCRLLPFYRDAFRTLVLRTPIDRDARLNDGIFHDDGIHLNERGGLIDADVIETFLNNDLAGDKADGPQLHSAI